MRYKKLKLIAVSLLTIGLTGLQAQEAISASGGNASGSGGSASYTVGQMVYTTNNGTNGSVAQGVQQPYEISVVIAIEETNGITLQCLAYPNPTTEFIKLKVKSYKVENLSYQLFDILGKLLETKNLEVEDTNIVLSNLVPATYFIKVIQGEKEIKTFKIIKY
jgi:hypothetical protein